MNTVASLFKPGDARTAEEIDLDVRALEAVLLAAEVGAMVSYESLKEAIGHEVQSGNTGYHPLGRARRRLIEEHGVLFEAKPGEGLVRQNATGEALSHVGRRHRRARRQFLSSRKVLAFVVDVGALTGDERTQFYTQQTINELMAQKLRPAAYKKLTVAVANAQAALPPQKALEVFLK